MSQMRKNFSRAKLLRGEASKCGAFELTKKIKLADEALDCMELVLAELIIKVEDLERGENHASNNL